MNCKEKGLAAGTWSLTDHGQLAEQKLKSKPYDLDAWETLIKEAQVKKTIMITNHQIPLQTTALIRGRMLFEKLIEKFPSCGRFWRIYIEQEMSQQNYEEVEQLFQRCLLKVLSLDLWRCYINYIKNNKRSQENYRCVVHMEGQLLIIKSYVFLNKGKVGSSVRVCIKSHWF